MGFHKLDGRLHAVVKQSYVKADAITDLDYVKSFMEANGFKNHRRHDYHHAGIGVIIEDLHDENVLTCDDILYFIDTVLYIVPDEFWNKT